MRDGRLRIAVAAAWLAGCYAPHFAAGGACETECPGDLACVDHICRDPAWAPAELIGPDAGGAAADALDHVDEAPDAASAACTTGSSHDEDNDGLRDSCDPCPHLAGDATDGDGDGVGDLCDPQPTIAKQRIRFFDSFQAARSEWQLGSGTTLQADQLRVFGMSTTRNRLLVANGEQRIITAGSIASVTATATRQLTIDVGHDASEATYHYSELYNPSGSTTTNVQVSERFADGSSQNLGRHTHPTELPLGAFALQIDVSILAQRMTLTAKLGGQSYSTLSGDTSTGNPLIAGPTIQLFGRSAEFRFDYFLVIETVP